MACIRIYTPFSPLLSHNNTEYKPLRVIRKFDLQLFAGEKTEEATPKRKQEARSKGQVAKSTEVNSAFVILMAFMALNAAGSYIYTELTDFMTTIFSNVAQQSFTLNELQLLFIKCAMVFLKTTLPVMMVILVTSLLVNFLQVGFIFSTEPLMPNFGKLNPITGFGRLFSKRSLVELAKSMFKIAIIGYFIYRFNSKAILEMTKLISFELINSLQLVAGMIVDLVFQISAVMLVLAALDFLYQNWQHSESLKMSKDDIKQEYKQMEGNPQIKGKIKERQRAMAMRRMMQEVPKADVVVTNPTHYAVALKYDKTMSAPTVIAKGMDFTAERIKEIARENKVAIVENKPLARALYGATEVGEAIPAELYKTVAEVLAYVYRLKRKQSS